MGTKNHNNDKMMYDSFKQSILRVTLLLVFALSGLTHVKAESTVYFFVDFRMFHKEYLFTVNGEKAFTLTGEVSQTINGEPFLYNMMMRKVVFKKADTYVVATNCCTKNGDYHAELNLNLEDGETYYVVVNANMKKNFYMELLQEKDGLKLMKKGENSKKYTINEPTTYDK